MNAAVISSVCASPNVEEDEPLPEAGEESVEITCPVAVEYILTVDPTIRKKYLQQDINV